MSVKKSWIKLFIPCILILITFSNTANHKVGAESPYVARLFLPVVFAPDPPLWIGPYGGSVISLASSPSQPNTVYAGTSYGGVFRSTDGGITWSSASRGLDDLFIDSLAVHPWNSQIVFAGTHSMGVYRSMDGGNSWQAVNNGIAANSLVYTLAVNPSNPNLIYAGTRIKGTFYHGILYQSQDGGSTWKSVIDYPDDWVYSLAINPNEPNIVVAAVHSRGPRVSHQYGNQNTWEEPLPPSALDASLQSRWLKGRAVAFDPSPESKRIYYGAWHDGFVSSSTNNGDPYILNSSWQMAAGAEQAHVFPNGFAVDPSAPNIVYFAAHINGSTGGVDLPGGIWRSDNSGVSWYRTSLMDRYMYSVASLGNGSVLAGTYMDGLYRSTNGGSSWSLSVRGLANAMITGMVFPSGQTIYASTKTGGGVWKSIDGGQTWVEFNSGLGDSQINGLVQHPVDPNILFALTSKAGLRRIDLRGGIWVGSAAVPLNYEAGGTLLMAQESPTMQLPADGAAVLADKGEAQPQMALLNAVSKPILRLRFSASNPNTAYLGTEGGGVYKSTDGGITWSASGLAGLLVSDIAIDRGNDNHLYAAANGKVYYSNDGGALWYSIAPPNPNLHTYAVTVWDSDPGAIYAGTNAGVYRLAAGQWNFSGLDGKLVTVFASPPTGQSRLYAAADQGAFVLHAPGADWSSIHSELDGVGVQSLNFDPARRQYLFAGTSNRGTVRVRVSP